MTSLAGTTFNFQPTASQVALRHFTKVLLSFLNCSISQVMYFLVWILSVWFHEVWCLILLHSINIPDTYYLYRYSHLNHVTSISSKVI
jgi:hypothetical protein